MRLVEAARGAAAQLARQPRGTRVRVVVHLDADGISGASVIVHALRRLGRPFYVTYTHDVSPTIVDALAAEPDEATLLVDVGASLLPQLARLPGLTIVLDHHPPSPTPTGDRLFHVNPHLAGLDGGRDACGSTTAFAFAVALDPTNWDLAPHALVGAWGDRQERGGLLGWNRQVQDEALAKGFLRMRTAPDLDDGPLRDVLAHAPPPWDAALRDVGDASQFLSQQGIAPDATVLEIPPRELEHLASLLLVRMLRRGAEPTVVRSLFRRVPTSPAHGDLALPRLVALVSASARENEPGLGLAFLLGDATARSELEALETIYHEKIRRCLQGLPGRARALPNLWVFDVPEAPYVGEACGIAMERILPGDRPTLAFVRVDGQVRVSARATPELVARGIHLGQALSDAARRHQGNGGGHAIASGATIPADQLDAFLSTADGILARQRRVGG